MEFDKTIQMLMFAYGDHIKSRPESVATMRAGIVSMLQLIQKQVKAHRENFEKTRFFGNSRYSLSGFFHKILPDQFENFQKFYKV